MGHSHWRPSPASSRPGSPRPPDGAGSGAALGGPFSGFVSLANGVSAKPSFRGLRPVPDLRDGVERLALPAGFQYRSFHDTSVTGGVTLDDGTLLPGRHDGMAAFAGAGGNSVLIRNHEQNANAVDAAFGPDGDWTYDINAHSTRSTASCT